MPFPAINPPLLPACGLFPDQSAGPLLLPSAVSLELDAAGHPEAPRAFRHPKVPPRILGIAIRTPPRSRTHAGPTEIWLVRVMLERMDTTWVRHSVLPLHNLRRQPSQCPNWPAHASGWHPTRSFLELCEPETASLTLPLSATTVH